MLFYSDNCRMIFFFLCMLCFLRTMTVMALYYFLAFFALRFSLLILSSVFCHPCKQNLSEVYSLFPPYFPLSSICPVNHTSSFAIKNLQNLPSDGNNRFASLNFLNINTFSPCYVMSP